MRLVTNGYASVTVRREEIEQQHFQARKRLHSIWQSVLACSFSCLSLFIFQFVKLSLQKVQSGSSPGHWFPERLSDLSSHVCSPDYNELQLPEEF
jgi:hypothetical protein